MGMGLLQAIAVGVLWALANAVYIDMRRKGMRGFKRILAFWFGTPTTWASLFLLPEGQMDVVRPPPDDEAALLREVRLDRARRITGEAGTPEDSGAEELGSGDTEQTLGEAR